MAGTKHGQHPKGPVAASTAATRALELEVHDLRLEVEELRRASRLKDECLTLATHELSAPLAAMKAYVEALLEHHSDPTFDQTTEFLRVLDRETSRLARIVERTLEVARLTRRGAGLRPEPLRFADLIDEVAVSLQPVLAARATTLEAELAADVPLVAADRDLLKQVLVNLVHNAVKFSPPGKTVRLRVLHTAGGVEVEVRDEGWGIAPEELGRVFEPYFRSGDDRIACERGTGLGLSIVKTIVEQHGGRVSVESQPDRGTVFRFTLPAA